MLNVPKLYSEVIPQGDLVKYYQWQKYRNSVVRLLHGVNPVEYRRCSTYPNSTVRLLHGVNPSNIIDDQSVLTLP